VLAATFADRLAASVPRQAVICDVESLAHLAGFATPYEEWPVGNPFVPCPAVLVVGPSGPVLVVASMYTQFCAPDGPPVMPYRSYDPSLEPDPVGSLRAELVRALHETGITAGVVDLDAAVPHWMGALLADHGFQLAHSSPPLTTDSAVVAAVERAARLADVAQEAVLAMAEPGSTELELAGRVQERMAAMAGKRVATILTVTAGPASGTRPGPATSRAIASGDLVLCDVAPWIDGAWADAATTVCAGRPSRSQQQAFDAVREALDLAIELCRPGAIGREVDAAVRASLSGHGAPYPHHTGHGIGARWWQGPAITSYSGDRIDDGMIVAVEPALYDPEIGGVRLEHTFRVSATGNVLLTRHDHRLTA
jgi:Xaa-Pro dipeptidase